MPTFSYKGRDNEGNVKSGERIASSADSLGSMLIQENIFPTEIVAKNPTSIGFWERYKKNREPKPKINEISMFCRQMYTLTRAGVSISRSFRQLGDSSKNMNMRAALYGMAESIEAGRDLASSMQDYPKVFNPFMISMIRVGQSSGRLPEAFLRINQYIEMEYGAIQNLTASLRYPMFVMIAIVIAIGIINIFVIPTFTKVFAQTHMVLPLPTRIIMAMSQFFVNNWAYMLAVLIGGIVGLRFYIKTPVGKLAWNRFLLKLPIFGNIAHRIILLRFTQSFAITISSGVSLIEGIGLVADSITNEYGKQKVLSMQSAIEHGNTLTQAATATDLFTPLELQMLSVSEETGELAAIMEQLAEFHRREVEYDIKRLSDMIEPIVIVAMAAMVLMMALAVYLPIWNMTALAKGPGG